MSDWRELLEDWGIPYIQRGGVTLVARSVAPACIKLIYERGCLFYGYDAFTLTTEWIQPHMEWSPSWDGGEAPTPAELLVQLGMHP
jgi:hypothetical protein